MWVCLPETRGPRLSASCLLGLAWFLVTCVCVLGLVNGAQMSHGAESGVCLLLAVRCSLGQVVEPLCRASQFTHQ